MCLYKNINVLCMSLFLKSTFNFKSLQRLGKFNLLMIFFVQAFIGMKQFEKHIPE